MDGVVPIGASPFPLIGRRGLQDQLGIEPLLRDPSWRGGHYSEQPTNFPIALMAFWPLMFGSEYLLKKAPTRQQGQHYLRNLAEDLACTLDANDWIYQLRVNDSYNLIDCLERIQTRVLMVDLAGDELYPAALGGVHRVLDTLGLLANYVRIAEAQPYGHAGISRTVSSYGPRIGAFLTSLTSPQP